MSRFTPEEDWGDGGSGQTGGRRRRKKQLPPAHQEGWEPSWTYTVDVPDFEAKVCDERRQLRGFYVWVSTQHDPPKATVVWNFQVHGTLVDLNDFYNLFPTSTPIGKAVSNAVRKGRSKRRSNAKKAIKTARWFNGK